MKWIRAFLFVLFFVSAFDGIAQEDDPCSGSPVYLPVYNTCIMNTFFIANLIWTHSPQATCSAINYPDVWYEVVVPNTNTLIFEINCSYGTMPIGQSILNVYHGSCPAGPFSSLGCAHTLGSNDTANLTITGLNQGDTLFVRISLKSAIHGTFGMCIHPPVVSGIPDIQMGEVRSYYLEENNELVIESPKAGTAEVQVFNGLGQSCINRKLFVNGTAKIPLGEMPSGLYFSVVNANGIATTAKLFIPK